ncbi:MAG: DUF1538 domain-containing protein [Pyramidobacter sp.]|nr:DUF1538 domain-containing protein [Pyramidobacter sp.]
MNKLKGKIGEALTSVTPISLLVVVLSALIVPMPAEILMLFLVGAVLLVVGMGFFSLGADMAMMPMGEGVGKQITLLRKLSFAVPVCFLLGLITTIAEPDLQVLAGQVPAVSDFTLVITVAGGVGVFLVIAMLRPLLKIDLAHVLLFLYGVVFLLAYFTPQSFIPVAFDAGGVTTGPITVPFIISLGVGMASMRHDESSREDSFGLVSLCSVGPILTVMLLGMIYNPQAAAVSQTIASLDKMTSIDIAESFFVKVPAYLKEVSLALTPVVAFFVVFQGIFALFRRGSLVRIVVGVAYTFIGLVLFLTGVNVGFMPAGHFIGKSLAMSEYRWLLLPIGLIIGYYVVDAEPAVHVLNKQVEEITGGTISQRAMHVSLACGVACSVAFAMLRAITGLSIYWIIIPGYALALALTFFVPPIFTGIAFDSGGVASGPMTATFLLPLAMGACEGAGGSILTDAFGVVAMVAMTPLISIQILGVLYNMRLKAAAKQPPVSKVYDNFVIIEYTPEELAYND